MSLSRFSRRGEGLRRRLNPSGSVDAQGNSWGLENNSTFIHLFFFLLLFCSHGAQRLPAVKVFLSRRFVTATPLPPLMPGTQLGELNFQASPDRSFQILMSPASAAPASPASSIFHEGTCCGWRKTPAESSPSAAVGSFNFIMPPCKLTSPQRFLAFAVCLDPFHSDATLLCTVADYVNGSPVCVRPTGVTFPRRSLVTLTFCQ